MKTTPIIYLVGAYPQWSETFVRQDLALLQDLELPLYPIALFPGDAECDPAWPKVSYLDSAPAPAGASGPPTVSLRSRILPRWVATRLSLFRHRHRVRALAARVRELGATHIHAEFADLPALVASAVARKLGCTYSVSAHARDVHLAKFSPSVIYGRARFIVVCNRDALLGVVRQHRASESRMHLVHHGLDLACWRFREPPMVAPGAPLRLLFVGRFVPKKGLNVLFRALGLLAAEGLGVRLSMVGSGPMEGPLRSMADTLHLGETVSWHGVVSRDEVAHQMRQHDILVMPSVVSAEGDRDGIPNVVLEAMACGVPVVGSNAGSLREVLEPATGWGCPAGDAKALAQAIRQVYSSPKDMRARCRTARELVVSRFDARSLARKRAALLRSVLA